jgi:hypothetical protein
MADKLTFDVTAHRLDAHGSVASAKDATVTLDTDLAGRRDAFNPAELLLAAIAACMIKGIERVAPMLKFEVAMRGGTSPRRAAGHRRERPATCLVARERQEVRDGVQYGRARDEHLGGDSAGDGVATRVNPR